MNYYDIPCWILIIPWGIPRHPETSLRSAIRSLIVVPGLRLAEVNSF
ncbi:MAG: hypothetical protein ACT6FF_07900 [Methanosarcinaceae archaeon]